MLESGVKIVLEETGPEDYIRGADLVVTGEGRLDAQTVMGKAPIGVAGLAGKYGKPVLAFAGCVTPEAAVCNGHGIDAFFPILRAPVTLREAMEPANAREKLTDCGPGILPPVPRAAEYPGRIFAPAQRMPALPMPEPACSARMTSIAARRRVQDGGGVPAMR